MAKNFRLYPHIFDKICAGHDHEMDYPQPDGEALISWDSPTEDNEISVRSQQGIVEVSREVLIVHYESGNHLYIPAHRIYSIFKTPPTEHWYRLYRDWYYNTHGISLDDAAELEAKSQEIGLENEINKFFGIGD